MRAFTSTELSRMQDTQESAMQDTCKVGVYSSGSTDGYGVPNPTYTYGSALQCGLEHVRPREVQASGQVAVISARLRLPIGTLIATRDRIQVTHRYGAALASAQVFEIVGPPERGPSGLVVNLMVVTDGS